MDNILGINVHKRGVIKEIYSSLLELQSPSLSIIKSHWEKDLAISDELWDALLLIIIN